MQVIKRLFFKIYNKIPKKDGKIDFNFIIICIVIMYLLYNIFFGPYIISDEYCSWWYDLNC